MRKPDIRVFVCVAVSLLALQACFLFKKDDSSNDAAPGTPGGKITVPVGTKCDDDAVCGGGRCVNNGCVPGARCTDDSVCEGTKCLNGGCVPASASNGEKDGDETDVDCGGLVAPRCAVGLACLAGTDCNDGVCGGDNLCAAPAPNDGVKNGDETDVDCGGSSGIVCGEGKACNVAAECDSKFCTDNVCEPRMAGRQDGDETDVDCGGLVAPACAAGSSCLADTDCQSQGCDANLKCALSRSCKPVHGGMTCGTGEFADGSKNHESCCKSLEVPSFSDATAPGKKVFLDKYEITSGRLRAFVNDVSKDYGGVPNIRDWMSKHRPATRWNNQWENELPQAMFDGSANYTVSNPTSNLLYPGQDKYSQNSQQSTWYVDSGNWTVFTGLAHALGVNHLFPEYRAGPSWVQGPTYAATHALNCGNAVDAHGVGTYWFDKATIAAVDGGTSGRAWSQDIMDEKAANCTPFAMFAAFCVWDGGEIATDGVMDYVTSNSTKLAAGNTTNCANNTLNSVSDGTGGCYQVYFYPDVSPQGIDDSAKIAPPGRVPGDTVTYAGQTEPWMDMKGNLLEGVLLSSGLFGSRGYGYGFGSVTNHKLQQTTPRYKSGSYGARCMRFK